MIKFIMKNKMQLAVSFMFNLIMLFIVIILLAGYKNMINDDFLVLSSMIFGLLATRLLEVLIKYNRKEVRIRIILAVTIFTVLVIYFTTMTATGAFLGFLTYVIVFNAADTVHNIRREKSRLSLQDLDTK